MATTRTVAVFVGTRADLGPLTPETAWRYVYAIALWTEDAAGVTYLHLNDRLSSVGGKALSNRGADYLRANMLPGGVGNPFPFVDFIGRRYAFERVQQATLAAARAAADNRSRLAA